MSSPAFPALCERGVFGEVGAPEASVTAAPRLPIGKSDAARILRDQRLRDLVSSVAEWQRASGPERVWWRGHASWLIGQWRCLHAIPEKQAFQAAVAHSKRRAA